MACGAAHKSLTKSFCTKAAISLKITIPCTLLSTDVQLYVIFPDHGYKPYWIRATDE